MLAREVLAMIAALEGANAYYFGLFDLVNTAPPMCDNPPEIASCSTNPTTPNAGEILPKQTITCDDTIILGDTRGASNVNNGGLGVCDTSSGQFGQWYKFEDTTTCFDSVTFSLCGSTFDTKIQVWDDADCTGGFPTCVAGNNDSCGIHSRVTIGGDKISRRFYVFVTGGKSQMGAFTLTVACV